MHEPPPFRMINPVVNLQLDLQLLDLHPAQAQRPNEGPGAESATGLLDNLVGSILQDVMLFQDAISDLFSQPPVQMLITVEDLPGPLVDISSVLSLLPVQVLQPVLQHLEGEGVHLVRVEEPDVPPINNWWNHLSNGHLFNLC